MSDPWPDPTRGLTRPVSNSEFLSHHRRASVVTIVVVLSLGLPGVRFLTGQSRFFGHLSGQKYDAKPDN